MKFNLDDRSKPILKWAGGKSALLQTMLPFFPTQFERYIEPFFGGGAVFFSLEQSTPALLNDVNAELTNLYEVVRDGPNELMTKLDGLAERYSEAFYYELREQSPTEALDKAARTIFLNKTCFNGLYRQNSKGLFNVPFGKRLSCPALYERDNLLSVSKKLAGAQFLNCDFETVLDLAQAGDCVYCDPPYEPLSTTSAFTAYHGGGFSILDQARLKAAAERARARGAFVAISNSSAASILDLYSGYDVKRIPAKRMINSKGTARGAVDEVLVLM